MIAMNQKMYTLRGNLLYISYVIKYVRYEIIILNVCKAAEKSYEVPRVTYIV